MRISALNYGVVKGSRVASLVALLVVLLGLARVASALPVVIPDFAVDPSGPAFTIQAVAVGDVRSINIAAAPELTYGQPSVPDGTPDTLQMNWNPTDNAQPAQAGWELVFGADPDLRGGTMSLSVNPPGGLGTLGFSGISDISVVAVAQGGVAGGWNFNTDQLGLAPALLLPPANDLTATNGVSLLNNVMQDVTINFPLGNVPISPGSASITQVLPAGGTFIGPNNIIAGNNDFQHIIKLQYFENGLLRGETVIPGQSTSQPGLVNFWDHLSITVPPPTVPEPSSLLLAALGLFGLTTRIGRSRR